MYPKKCSQVSSRAVLPHASAPLHACSLGLEVSSPLIDHSYMTWLDLTYFSKCILCVPHLPGSLPREPPAVWSEHFSSVTFVPMHTFHKVWGRQTLCPCPDSELLHTVTCFSSVLPASIVSAIHSQLRKRFLYAWIRECIATLAAHSWEASSCGPVSNFRNRIRTA